jgi:hypothetical protein
VRGSVSLAHDNGQVGFGQGIATPQAAGMSTWWDQGPSGWSSHTQPSTHWPQVFTAMSQDTPPEPTPGIRRAPKAEAPRTARQAAFGRPTWIYMSWTTSGRYGRGHPMSTVDVHLIDRSRQKFDAGALPRVHPQNTWVSYGVGDDCDWCGDPLPRGHDLLEFDTARQTYRLHTGCYGPWEGELIRRGLCKPE